MTDHPDIVERPNYATRLYNRLAMASVSSSARIECADIGGEADAEITRLRAEAEALRKDAERWRALFTICDRDDEGCPYLAVERPRESEDDNDAEAPYLLTYAAWVYNKDEADAAIDAAIAATKEQQA